MTESLESRQAAARSQQWAVVSGDARAVVACPGAGKTRTIVERHCASPRGRSTGRAIVSFTKVAATQVRSRANALGRPDLLEHPHAITTLDGFFWRFLVRPFLPSPEETHGPVFRRLESWRDAPRKLRMIEYRPVSGSPVQFDLADFQFRFPGGRSAPIATLTGPARYEGPRRQLSDDEIAAVCRVAEQRRTDLAVDEHLLTGEETRRLATWNLESHRELLADTLASRFHEIVVDEVQDCSDIDAGILLEVERLGVPMMVVGDPDQAIYGFRASGGPAVSRLLDRSPAVALTGNWRSSQPICQLAATLRGSSRAQPDIALTARPGGDLPVHLLRLDAGEELIAFGLIADQASIAPADRLVVAHAATTLPGAGSQGRRPPLNPTRALAWAVSVLRHPSADQKARALAEQTLQTAIVRFWLPESDSIAAADRRSTLGVDPYRLRRLAAAALDQIPELSGSSKDWCAAARKVIASLSPTPDKEPKGVNISCPPKYGTKAASSLAGLSAPAAGAVAIRTDTVHGVKGEEAGAVLMVLPDDDRTAALVARWIGERNEPNPETDEALRVLYVAVTRARQLIAVALPERHMSAVAVMLLDRHVPIAAVPTDTSAR